MTKKTNHTRRVVISGLGLVTCLGQEVETVWQSLIAGRSGIRNITLFDAHDLPCKIAGEIPEFDPETFIPAKEARRMARNSQMALASAMMAVDDSALPRPFPDPTRVGVYFGTAIGGWDRGYEGIEVLRERGFAKVNPFSLPSTLPNMAAFHVTHYFKALGPNCTITTACATGTQTIGEGAQAIRNGWADVVIAGGTEAIIQHFVMAGFAAMRALPIHYNDAPTHASRPFELQREGFVFSEGAACVILESLEHAQARNARIYAEVAGFGATGDAYHMAAPDPEGEGAARTMLRALDDSGLEPEQVNYINAHGTSTPANDATETKAIKSVFGDYAHQIPISSTKSMLGHAMGASGAIEAIVCALSIHNQIIHPTINYQEPDPELDLDFVPNQARSADIQVALSNSFGLGGQNACLVLKRLE
ncbi:MAG: beta-ketoacyl-[acyl-carrier-protein] synthase II [Anaerolineales bacterium]|nr:MAG: beta-ketoacyl-[acyl-carrier-protein] synthase II [Anaerolineales bacterium]